MSKKYSVIVSENAKCELLKHIRFLSNVNKNSAKNLAVEFDKVAKSLEDNPERGPRLNSDDAFYRRYRVLYFGKRYAAIYIVEGDSVYIDHVADTRQMQPWII